MSNNAGNAGNQQATLQNISWRGASETTRVAPLDQKVIRAYLQGALHDATFSSNRRYRFSQKGTDWLIFLKNLFGKMGYSSWIYREGRNREVFVLETLTDFLDFAFDPGSLKDISTIAAYIRGFFDAEGGMPHNLNDRFYIQLVQNSKSKLEALKKMLKELGVETGSIHNPSKRADPHYWRMYVSADSYGKFICEVGSWHPNKIRIFGQRMKI